ncbi:FMN-binding negative transcriptional regulator [Shewanella sedimentimangrovi]|uniref:FMN-binding negative transcriptional regulator n=1 Tax=Shewanella sedimentimangrovi TaxID=2814293 RepID=A0ABX7QXK2_9GAMM|nr:FMN-binding negative transcriptional regulator [Shewanella sedimentimangrovi]QSX35651.1 FMN-binding negative transcriptional regulator [Shewanella sedimentimangrovi]
MYIPPAMAMTDESQVFDFIERYPFGLLISNGEQLVPQASHLPFLLDREARAVHCHLARANDHWRLLDGQQVRLVFSGPHAYISPLWYRNQPSVPTWNYSAVHVLGRARCLPTSESIPLLMRMCERFDPELTGRTEVLAPEYVERLSKAIVAVTIEIESLEAKVKYGQHKKAADQQGVFDGLSSSSSAEAQGLAADMMRLDIGTGRD